MNQATTLEKSLPNSAARRWLFRVTTTLIGIVIGLLIIEGALWLFDIQPSHNIVLAEIFTLVDDPQLNYALVPHAPDGETTISSAGLRDREFDLQKSPDVFRIAAIGDSVTFGLSYSQQDSYPKQLETMLNTCAPAGAPAFEVMNFGVVGYSARQVARQLETKVLPFKPDLIIYGYVVNDPLSVSLELDLLQRFEDVARFGQRDSMFRPVLEKLHHVRVFRALRYLLIAPPNRINETVPEQTYKALSEGRYGEFINALHSGDQWRDAQQAINSMASHDIPVVLSLFPTRMCFGPDNRETLRDVRKLVRDEAEGCGMHVLDLFQPYLAALERQARTTHLDFLHPTPQGYRIAAAAILAELVRRGDPPLADLDVDCAAGDDIQLNAAIDAVRTIGKQP